jgi:hypothetical protein
VFSRRENVELPYIAGCFHSVTSAADCDDMFNLLSFNGDFFQAILRVHRVFTYLSFFFLSFLLTCTGLFRGSNRGLPLPDGQTDLLQVPHPMSTGPVSPPYRGVQPTGFQCTDKLKAKERIAHGTAPVRCAAMLFASAVIVSTTTG